MQNELKRNKFSKRTVLEAVIIILLIPLTIAFGELFLGERKHYFIGILMIICVMIPFFMVFEKRKPKARELVIIAVLCAIAIAGRAAFFWVPQVKPVLAIVIIAGVCLGGEAGFLVGAVTGFVSNFFFGQGPWTPWQMFAFGLIGFLAGVIFKKATAKKKIIPLCIFGGLSTFIIYGGLLNMSTALTATGTLTIEAFILACSTSLIFDLIHAISTVVFLLLLAKPMIDKLERIKIKYGF